MNSIMQTIVAQLRIELAERKKHPLELTAPLPQSLCRALTAGHGIIAEIKSASPSCGIIRKDFHPVELARELAASGAAALSVLTEPNGFRGSLATLQAVSGAVDIPCLRKDFIFDEYQILEARQFGASAVLLIAALLDARDLTRLAEYAHQLGLEVLGEAHNSAEVRCLLDAPVDLIGVNARNLNTFQTDLSTVVELIKMVPYQRFPVAESGIASAHDIKMLADSGARAFLIGETLMRAASPGAKLRELLA